MVHVIYCGARSRRLVAALRSWDGKVIDSASVTGHWSWCIGRELRDILTWAKGHKMKWETTANDAGWENAVRDIHRAANKGV